MNPLLEGKIDMDHIRASVVAPPSDYVPPEDGAADETKPKKTHRNQFNFSERAAQTVNNTSRVCCSNLILGTVYQY